MNTWKPRQEIILAAHRWYWIAASFLLGALLAWMVSFIWPASYRATIDLYVGLNAHRAARDLYIADIAPEKFENLDDYKHWQMSQLNALVMSDAYLDETLTRLQADGPSWQDFDVPALRAILSVAWRNTGEWHFSALTEAPALSAQAVTTWSDVVLEKTNESIAAAGQLVILDSRLNAVDQALTAAEARRILLLETQAILAEWHVILEDKPAAEPLDSLAHWNLLSQVTLAADWNLGWAAILEVAPPLGAVPAEYLDWLMPVNALIDAELSGLPARIAALEAERADVSADYALAAGQSRALSANLEVAQIKDEPPNIVHLRPAGTLMLVGGLLGILVWAAVWLIQITRKTER